MKFYFHFKFNIYVICFIIHLLDIYMSMTSIFIKLHVSIFILFDFKFV